MTEKHLIVLDLDGTLLTDNKTISSRTKKTLLKLKEDGHEVMIATGRPFRSSELYYRELGLTTPTQSAERLYARVDTAAGTCCATSSCAWSHPAPRASPSAPGCRGA